VAVSCGNTEGSGEEKRGTKSTLFPGFYGFQLWCGSIASSLGSLGNASRHPGARTGWVKDQPVKGRKEEGKEVGRKLTTLALRSYVACY